MQPLKPMIPARCELMLLENNVKQAAITYFLPSRIYIYCQGVLKNLEEFQSFASLVPNSYIFM